MDKFKLFEKVWSYGPLNETCETEGVFSDIITGVWPRRKRPYMFGNYGHIKLWSNGLDLFKKKSQAMQAYKRFKKQNRKFVNPWWSKSYRTAAPTARDPKKWVPYG